ncbi:hypothetical protein [Hoeflea marina]|nr:hypothetical protein [Hoeflea marina]
MMILSSSAFAADPVSMAPAEPAAVRNACSGHVEAYLGGVLPVVDGDSDDSMLAYGGSARANCTFHQNWNVQGDLFGDRVEDGDDSVSMYGAAGHLFWRDPSSFAVGIFATVSRASQLGTDFDQYTFGPEFQAYLGNVTLYGQAEYGQLTIGDLPLDFDVWSVRGVVRYFAKENLRFDAELAYRDREGTLFPFPNTFTAALQANYRFDDTPYTIFGRYQYDQAETEFYEIDTHKLSAGLRVSFGAKTLLEEDRYGATMDTLRTNSPAF